LRWRNQRKPLWLPKLRLRTFRGLPPPLKTQRSSLLLPLSKVVV
jgi:hypothetical protein